MPITADEFAYAAKYLRGRVAEPNRNTIAGKKLAIILERVANYLMTSQPGIRQHENIKLEYPLYLEREDTRYICRNGAEFFMDEHGIQWVKFVPSNGYNPHKEHIWRTEGVTVIKDTSRVHTKMMDRAVAGADLREGRDAAIGAAEEESS